MICLERMVHFSTVSRSVFLLTVCRTPIRYDCTRGVVPMSLLWRAAAFEGGTSSRDLSVRFARCVLSVGPL